MCLEEFTGKVLFYDDSWSSKANEKETWEMQILRFCQVLSATGAMGTGEHLCCNLSARGF